MAKLMHSDGRTEEVVIPKKDSLDVLQRCVGGMIEVPGLGSKSQARKDGFRDLVCNEEGKLMGLAPNLAATKYANYTHDILCGPILFVKAGELR